MDVWKGMRMREEDRITEDDVSYSSSLVGSYDGIPFGMMWRPFGVSSSSSSSSCVAVSGSKVEQCENCDAHANVYNCGSCIFCGHEAPPLHPLETGGAAAAAIMEYYHDDDDGAYLVEAEEEIVFLVLDGHLTQEEVECWMEALQSLEKKKKNVVWGLMVFSSAMRIFHLSSSSSSGVTAVDVLGPQDDFVFHPTRMEMYLTKDLHHVLHAITSHYNLPATPTTTTSTTSTIMDPAPTTATATATLSRKERLKQKRQARLAAAAAANKQQPIQKQAQTQKQTQKKQPKVEHRCTYEAIALVMDILQYNNSNTIKQQRLLLVTNGSPTQLQQHHNNHNNDNDVDDDDFGDLGQLAWQQFHLGMDVCTMGSSSILNVPAYQALVQPSHGHVWNHHIQTHNLSHNLQYILQQTHILNNNNNNNTNTLHQQHHHHPNNHYQPTATLQLHMSRFMRASHYVGPAVLLQQDKQEEGKSILQFQMGRYDPLATLSLLVDVPSSSSEYYDHAYFQWIVKYNHAASSTTIVRVTTHQLPIATHRMDFMESLNTNVLAVLLAKEAVHRATLPQSTNNTNNANNNTLHALDRQEEQDLTHHAKQDLDTTIHILSKQFQISKLQNNNNHHPKAQMSGMEDAMDFAFPPELAKALYQLYHLRRGPLLGTMGLQSLDDCRILRQLFLRLPLHHCLHMMEPSVYKCLPDFTFAALPPVTLTLWNTSVLAVDHYDCLFVWSGKETWGKEYDEYRTRCKQLLLQEVNKYNRFPMCEKVIWLKEGDSMSRTLTTRLAPAHADTQQHQLAYFPDLSSLSTQGLAELQEKFKFYDETADASFRKWFWNVASATYIPQGTSLTE